MYSDSNVTAIEISGECHLPMLWWNQIRNPGMSRGRASTHVRNGGHDRRRIPASRRLSGTRPQGIDHHGCERLVGGDQVARRSVGTRWKSEQEEVGRLGGSDRHHAQPPAISNP